MGRFVVWMGFECGRIAVTIYEMDICFQSLYKASRSPMVTLRVLLPRSISSQTNSTLHFPFLPHRLKMKLFALPLSRKPLVNSTTPLFYLHAQKLASSTKSAPERSALAKLASRGIDKAADTWSGFGSAKDGSWKRRIYVRREFPNFSVILVDGERKEEGETGVRESMS